MKQSEVKVYESEEELKEAYEMGVAIFPCSTPNLFYDAMLSRYFLTVDGANKYGIDIERKYVSSNPNKVDECLRETTEEIYEFFMNTDAMEIEKIEFLIAKSISPSIKNKYKSRWFIEQALRYQCEYRVEIGRKRLFNYYSEQNRTITNQEHFQSARYLSQSTRDCLATLGILYAGNIGVVNIDDHKTW